jgi:hypothetical protein
LPGVVRAAVTLAVGTTLIVHGGEASPVMAKAKVPPALVDLSSAGELQRQFNADRDDDRLMLLLSPT